MSRAFGTAVEDAVLVAITAAGVMLFIAPLLLGSRFPQAVLLFSALVAVSALVVLAVAVQTHQLSTRLLAILAALVAVDAVMRLVIVIGLGRRITEIHGLNTRELYYSAQGQVLAEWYNGLVQAYNAAAEGGLSLPKATELIRSWLDQASASARAGLR